MQSKDETWGFSFDSELEIDFMDTVTVPGVNITMKYS